MHNPTYIADKGLGMVASGVRNIKPGIQYDNLFPTLQLKGTDPGLKKGDVFDTLKEMEKVVRRTLAQTKRISKLLKSSSNQSTSKNTWDFIYRHIQYKKDKAGVEQLREPARTWKDRKSGVDCDCYAIFISSILSNQGIDHAFRMTKYSGDWQHVYVVVPKRKGANLNSRSEYVVIDPVVDKFNYEVPFTKKHDHIMTMPIQLLNGLDPATINGGVTPGFFGQTDSNLPSFGEEFDFLDGISLGSVEETAQAVESGFLSAMKSHLINTRKIVAANPDTVSQLYDPNEFLGKLDLLLNNWDDPVLRDRALDHLEKLEDVNPGLNGLDGFFKKLKRGIKKVARVLSAPVRAPIRRIKAISKGGVKRLFRTEKKVFKRTTKDIVKVAKVVGKTLIRFNPVTIAVRAAMLLFFKLNLFRASEKLGYGYWTKEEALRKGMSVATWSKHVSKLNKVRHIFKGIQGRESKLKKAILSGWNKGTKKHRSLRGLGVVPALPAAVVPASPLITTVLSLLKGMAIPLANRLLKRKPTPIPQANPVVNQRPVKPEVKVTTTGIVRADPPSMTMVAPSPVVNQPMDNKVRVLTTTDDNPEPKSSNNKKLLVAAAIGATVLTVGAIALSK